MNKDTTFLSERLERIETECSLLARSNRWLKAGMIGLVAVLLLGAAAANTDISAKSVTAQKFVLMDAKDASTRGTIEISQGGPAITLFNANKKPAMVLKVMDGDPSSTALSLFYSDGKPAYSMIVARDQPTFGIRSPLGKFYFHMGKLGDTPPVFEVFDDNGNRVAQTGGKTN